MPVTITGEEFEKMFNGEPPFTLAPPLFNGLKVKRLTHAADIPLPAYQSPGAAGFDLCAAVPEYSSKNATIPMLVHEGVLYKIPTGFCFEVPRGFELQIRPRSGLALKFGVTIVNSPGTIDSDYRGEVFILLYRMPMIGIPSYYGREYGAPRFTKPHDFDSVSSREPLPMEIWHGDRISQAVLAPVARVPAIVEVEELSDTERGEGAFGSTGR